MRPNTCFFPKVYGFYELLKEVWECERMERGIVLMLLITLHFRQSLMAR
jgi:hypothetical protein